MRTTDILVAGMLSPAAVAGVGVGDSFSRIVNRVGGGLGDATIALSSQDTGADALDNRGEAISQALLLGFLAGIPFVFFGLAFSELAIAILGAERDVVRLGGQYLQLILIAAPMIHLSKIGGKALQGMGDTRTPMGIRGLGNVLNISGTVVLAFGLGPFPRLSVIGIALATVLGESVIALLFLFVLFRPASSIKLVRPTRLTIAKQLAEISLPRVGEGGVVLLADLPFNAILLTLGTEANAAFHIARRIYQQILGPIYRAFGVTANILVGQSLSESHRTAYMNGVATTVLGVLIAACLSLLLYAGRAPFVNVFTTDPETATHAMFFIQAFAIAGLFYTVHSGIRGGLRGGSNTRDPFYATLIGMFVFLLGISYVGTVHLDLGVFAVAIAVILDFGWRAGFLCWAYYRQNWMTYGTTLMEQRGSVKPTKGRR